MDTFVVNTTKTHKVCAKTKNTAKVLIQQDLITRKFLSKFLTIKFKNSTYAVIF